MKYNLLNSCGEYAMDETARGLSKGMANGHNREGALLHVFLQTRPPP
jgi:hypothetical protein